jgi:hypothetical protein
LTNIDIPDSVNYIDAFAFRENQITSVVVPASVEDLSPYAFDDNVEIIRR